MHTASVLRQRLAHSSRGGPLSILKERWSLALSEYDPQQAYAASVLQQLHDTIVQREGSENDHDGASGLTSVDSLSFASSGIVQLLTRRWRAKEEVPSGVYLCSSTPGTGKTMLMDLFRESLPSHVECTRAHFRSFMLDVHAQMKQNPHSDDPMQAVARSFTRGMQRGSLTVLCLDELFVHDVADAMLIRQLFKRMWQRGLVLVATSNTHPKDLYSNGLQREAFVPFIQELMQRCLVVDMQSTTDYRTRSSKRLADDCLIISGQGSDAQIKQKFQQCCDRMNKKAESIDVPVRMGRSFHVHQACQGYALLTFAEVCGQPFGAADYLALASKFHTIFITSVKALNAKRMAEAQRLITLVDCMYDKRVRIGMALESPPRELFAGIVTNYEAKRRQQAGESLSDVAVDDQLGSSKERCISRMLDMDSFEYARVHAALYTPERLHRIHSNTNTRQSFE